MGIVFLMVQPLVPHKEITSLISTYHPGSVESYLRVNEVLHAVQLNGLTPLSCGCIRIIQCMFSSTHECVHGVVDAPGARIYVHSLSSHNETVSHSSPQMISAFVRSSLLP